MPMTLPMRRSRGRTVERTTSTTRLCFSSTTPVSTVNPKLKMPTRISTAPMFANRNCASSASVCGSSAWTVGACWAARSSSGGTPASVTTACVRKATTDAVTSWVTNWSGSLSKRISPGPDRSAGTIATPSTDSSASAASPAATSANGTTSTSRSSWLGGRGDREGQAGRFRLDDPDLRRVIVAEQQRRNDERPHHEHGGERDRQDEAATAAALDHLAPGDEPDAPPATHRVSSTTGDGAGVTASMNSSESFGG